MKDLLTVRAAIETADHEAMVREMYLDSQRIPTWAIGITDASGHKVGGYRDNPQTIEYCLSAYIRLLRSNYVPAVLHAFSDYDLKENEFAAALSFHYNTGAIGRSEWVNHAINGNKAAARLFLETHYVNNGTLTQRRHDEAALFFDGTWHNTDGKISIFPVRKPSYTPDFRHGERVDVRDDMQKALTT